MRRARLTSLRARFSRPVPFRPVMIWPALIWPVLIWSGLAVAVVLPVALAATSPLLQWRDPVYVLGGFAGAVAMALMLVQPLLVSGHLPGLPGRRARRAHHWVGASLVLAVGVHVAALWLTSPPDVVDALLFRSPTAFSAWGVVAMWAVFATALLAAFRRKLRLRVRVWWLAHTGLAGVIVVGTVVHAMLIEGTMETVSKVAICALVLAGTAKVVSDVLARVRRTTQR